MNTLELDSHLTGYNTISIMHLYLIFALRPTKCAKYARLRGQMGFPRDNEAFPLFQKLF